MSIHRHTLENKRGWLDREYIAEYYKLILPLFWKRGLLISLLLLLSSLTILPFPFLSRYIIDTIIPGKNLHLLMAVMIVLVAFFIFDNLLSVIRAKIESKFNQDISIFLRMRIASKLGRVDDVFFRKTDRGILLARFLNDVEKSQIILFNTITQVVVGIIQMLFGLVSMLYLDVRMTLLLLALSPFYIITLKKMGNHIQTKSSALIKSKQRFYRIIQEFIANIDLIKSYVADRFIDNRLKDSMQDYKKKDVEYQLVNAVASAIVSFISSIGPLIIIGYGGYRIIKGDFTLGTLVAFTSLIDFLFNPLSDIINTGFVFRSVTPNIKNLLNLFNSKEEDLGKVEHRQISSGKIEFKDVSLVLDNKKILSNISFKIKDKEMVSFVGESGAGKSTIVNMLIGLWDPTKGEIYVDDKNIGKIEVKGLRKGIALVSQKPAFFEASIYENIKLGNKNISLKTVRKAAGLAQIDKVIMKLPNKYYTVLNNEELCLSIGQLQRISLARALVHDTKIIVLDEFSSALDPETEALILESIQSLKGRKTILIVAHHRSCIKSSDKIFVLKKGRIVEKGTFNELRRKKCSELDRIFALKAAERLARI